MKYIIKLWDDHPFRIILPVVGAALALMVLVYLHGNATIEDELGGPTQFGQFGDYIGGVLNPIFGFLTVLLLIGTAQHSRKELNLARQEYNRRQIEDSLKPAISDIDEVLAMKQEQPYVSKIDGQRFYDLASLIGKDLILGSAACEEFSQRYRAGTLENPYFVTTVNYISGQADWVVELTVETIKRTEVDALKVQLYGKAIKISANVERLGGISKSKLTEWEKRLKNALDEQPEL